MPHWFDELLKNDLPTFIGKTLATVDPGASYLPNWHIDLIAEYLEAARRGEINRLIINMPPRALKSVCVSVAWPAWLIGHDPRSRIMAASYKERAFGELLHPERETMPLVERAKIELGSAAFAAQYQQQPVPEEGNMVHPAWLGRYILPPASADRRVQSWDTAIKSGARHDASVCLTFAELEGRSYLLDARVMRHDYPDLKRIFYTLAEQWQPQAILIEDRASGQQLLQDARRETTLPLIAMQPRHDKVTRFAAISAMIEAGRLMLPERAPWLADFETELFAFPGGAHDDQVDALTQYLDWLRRQAWEKLRIRRV